MIQWKSQTLVFMVITNWLRLQWRILKRSILQSDHLSVAEEKKVNRTCASGQRGLTWVIEWEAKQSLPFQGVNAIYNSCTNDVFSTALAVLFTLVDSGIDVVVCIHR